MLEKLHHDLELSGFFESELFPELVPEILKQFCRHRRLLRILLTLCDGD